MKILQKYKEFCIFEYLLILFQDINLTNIQKYKILYIFSIFASFILGPVKYMHTFDIIEGLNIYQELVYENKN